MTAARQPATTQAGSRRRNRPARRPLGINARHPDDVLPDEYTFFTVEKVKAPQARTKLDEGAGYFASDTAAAHPRRNDDCTDVRLSVLNEVVTATTGYIGTRQIQPNERALIQAVTVLIALPGLVLHCAKDLL